MEPIRAPRYAHHHFPAEVISYAIWLYFRFPLGDLKLTEYSRWVVREAQLLHRLSR
jgi:transposase-like protein